MFLFPLLFYIFQKRKSDSKPALNSRFFPLSRVVLTPKRLPPPMEEDAVHQRGPDTGKFEYGYTHIYHCLNHFSSLYFYFDWFRLQLLLLSVNRCEHYKRRCKIRAPCCDQIFSCRHCHNEATVSLSLSIFIIVPICIGFMHLCGSRAYI